MCYISLHESRDCSGPTVEEAGRDLAGSDWNPFPSTPYAGDVSIRRRMSSTFSSSFGPSGHCKMIAQEPTFALYFGGVYQYEAIPSNDGLDLCVDMAHSLALALAQTTPSFKRLGTNVQYGR